MESQGEFESRIEALIAAYDKNVKSVREVVAQEGPIFWAWVHAMSAEIMRIEGELGLLLDIHEMERKEGEN